MNCLHLSCIFALWNNRNRFVTRINQVVNCLHLSCIFALWNNPSHRTTCNPLLWIACIYLVSLLFETTSWKKTLFWISCELLAFILYLCSLKQHMVISSEPMSGCELLAFILYLRSLKQHDMDKTKSISNLEVVSEKKNPARLSWIFLCYDHFFRFKTAPIAGMVCPPP